MPSDERAARRDGDVAELHQLEATLRQHKEHFDSLIASHEQQDRGGGFLASLAGALHGFAEVVETGLFGNDEPSADAEVRHDPDKGIRQTVAALRAGVSTDSTDADRADTLTHLRQVSAGIQERLDLIARRIADHQGDTQTQDSHAPSVTADVRSNMDEQPPASPAHRHEGAAGLQQASVVEAAHVSSVHDRVEPAPPVVSPQRGTSDSSSGVAFSKDLPPIVLTDSAPVVDEPIIPIIPIIPIVLPEVAEMVVDDTEADDAREAEDSDGDGDAGDSDDLDMSVELEDTNRSFDPDEQVELGELAGEAYDVDELLRSGTTIADLRARDIPAAVLIGSGVSTHDLLGAGYSVADLHEANVDVGALRAEGTAVRALKDAGFTLEELRSVASVAELREVASASEMADAGLSARDLRDAYPVNELVPLFTVDELHDSGYHLDDLRHVVPFAELRSAFDLSELCASFSVHELRDAGLPASDLLHAGQSLSSLKDAGYGYHELMSAGASPADLRHLFPEEAFYESTGATSYFDEAQ